MLKKWYWVRDPQGVFKGAVWLTGYQVSKLRTRGYDLTRK